MNPPRTSRERRSAVRRHQGMSVPQRGSLLTGIGILAATVLVATPSLATDGIPPTAQAPANPAMTVIAARPEAERAPVDWLLSAAVGPVFAKLLSPSASVWPPAFGLMPGMAWHVDLQRRKSDEQFVAGVTVEGTFNRNGGGAGQQLLGADVFMGTSWRHRLWTLAATIGGGPGAEQVVESNGPTSSAIHLSYQLGLYVQGAVTAAVPLSRSLEALARLGVHLTTSHDEDWFAASTIGLRYRLP
jgi:hypothetical protein